MIERDAITNMLQCPTSAWSASR